MAMSEKTIKVLNYLQGLNEDENVTSADIAIALDMPKKSVDGVITSGLQRKGLAVRVYSEETLEDGTHKPIKLIQLTDEGVGFDAVAFAAAEAEAAKAKADLKAAAKAAADKVLADAQ